MMIFMQKHAHLASGWLRRRQAAWSPLRPASPTPRQRCLLHLHLNYQHSCLAKPLCTQRPEAPGEPRDSQWHANLSSLPRRPTVHSSTCNCEHAHRCRRGCRWRPALLSCACGCPHCSAPQCAPAARKEHTPFTAPLSAYPGPRILKHTLEIYPCSFKSNTNLLSLSCCLTARLTQMLLGWV